MSDAETPPRLTEAEIETYRRDGVVKLTRAFDPRWLDRLGRGIERNMEDPSPGFEARTVGDRRERYIEDFWVWSRFPEFEDFVRRSPAAGIAAQLLDARRINLVMDNWFLREAGARGRPPWHHDIAYFDFEGTICVLWLPLERTRRDTGISWVQGSHLWDRLFVRAWFRNHELGGEPGWVNGRYYEAPPDIDADPEAYDLVSFDTEPGDCVFFDIRTLHGALGETVPDRTVRRYTLRMAKEDGRIRYRGDWASGERATFEAVGHREGDALDSAFFPRLWEGG